MLTNLALLLVLFPLTSALRIGYTHHGDGTYYGAGGAGGGNCALRGPVPGQYSGRTPIAMNNAQYKGACGACLTIRGNGNGSGANPIIGPINAYVADKCPECKYGSVDLAVSGDGRWDVNWEFVPCPGGRVSYKFEGSNNYYMKVQPRGTRDPPRRCRIGGIEGRFTDDNFFVAQNGHGFGNTVVIETWTATGEYFKDWVTGKHGLKYTGSYSG